MFNTKVSKYWMDRIHFQADSMCMEIHHINTCISDMDATFVNVIILFLSLKCPINLLIFFTFFWLIT